MIFFLSLLLLLLVPGLVPVAALKFEQHKLFKRFVNGWWTREWRLVNPSRDECYFTVIMLLFVKRKIRFVEMFFSKNFFSFFFLFIWCECFAVCLSLHSSISPATLCAFLFYAIYLSVEFSCCCSCSGQKQSNEQSIHKHTQNVRVHTAWPKCIVKMFCEKKKFIQSTKPTSFCFAFVLWLWQFFIFRFEFSEMQSSLLAVECAISVSFFPFPKVVAYQIHTPHASRLMHYRSTWNVPTQNKKKSKEEEEENGKSAKQIILTTCHAY